MWDKRTKPYEALFYLMKYCPHLLRQNPDKKDKSLKASVYQCFSCPRFVQRPVTMA